MEPITDAFILSSPLQALNAIEARKTFASSRCAAVVVEGLCPASNEQIWSVIRESVWDHTAVIGMRRTPLYSRYLDVDRAVTLLRKVGTKRVFMGHHFDLGLHLVNSVPHRQTYLMDDGVATISVCLTRTRGEQAFRCNQPALHWYGRRLLMRLFDRFRMEDVPELHYFTVYDRLPENRENIMHRNTLDQLRNKKQRVEAVDEIWFLGLGSEAIFHSRELYLRYLREIRNRQPEAVFRYIPHRNESAEQIQAVQASAGMTPLLTGSPIELYLIRQQHTPRAVASFISSALYTIGLLFPSEIDVVAWRMDFAHVNSRYHRQFSDIYQYYSETAFIQIATI